MGVFVWCMGMVKPKTAELALACQHPVPSRGGLHLLQMQGEVRGEVQGEVRGEVRGEVQDEVQGDQGVKA